MQFIKTLSLLSLFVILFSCNKDDDNNSETKIEPYADQYAKDLVAMDKFIDEYSMKVSTDGNYDVTFEKIPSPNTNNLQSIKEEFTIETKTVKFQELDHKLYYISFTPGTDKTPTAVDSVMVTYKGEYIYTKKVEKEPKTDPKTYDEFIASAEFENNPFPIWFQLGNLVKGWQEIFPKFQTGGHTVNPDGSLGFNNFGAGVMFIPSAFGYYASARPGIPSYSPLIFNFKLLKLNYMDHDQDRIDSRFEDANGNGDYSDDDTDGDKVPDYLDRDDDADGILTKVEITNTQGGGYYDFANIPLCTGDGKKIHLTKCK
jgi:FKBP-type peptidyl-prolyl cis-trans isomerase FkpA